MRISAIAYIVIVSLFAGCTSYQEADRDSRQMALVLHKQVLTAKQEVRKKIGAERAYYRETIQTFEETHANANDIAFRRALISDARKEAASMIENSDAVTSATLADSIAINARELVDTFETGVERIRIQRQAQESSLEKLNELESKYSALERTLLELSVPVDRRRQMERVARFIEDVSKYYRELEKKEEAEDQPSQ